MINEIEHKEEHFTELSEIAKLLLEDGLDQVRETKSDAGVTNKDKYAILTENNELEEITRDELGYSIEGNMEVARTLYGHDLWSGFEEHMKDESTTIKATGLFGLASTNPFQLVQQLRIASQRKTFQSTCSICKDWQ
jgi:hypothetical protein